MNTSSDLISPAAFSEVLFEKMKIVSPAVKDMELYEFRYALNHWVPEAGWESVGLEAPDVIEDRIGNMDFFRQIEVKARVNEKIVLDPAIANLTLMLFTGLVKGAYPLEWIKQHFSFDVRGFNFLVKTVYFTPEVQAYYGGSPYQAFEPKQRPLELKHEIGYKEFQAANAEVDSLFISVVKRLIEHRGIPVIIAIAGPTAAGKTEIVERLCAALKDDGKQVTSIEMDNFLTDRDYREEKGIHTLGKEAIHLDIFKHSLEGIVRGEKIEIPRYDFIDAVSSHNLQGRLKPGAVPITIEPADIIFIEGNFPFLLEETRHLIGIKALYLTDDAIRLKRKWRRDIDYRKKYDPTYLRNRFFKDQFLMAQKCYLPQLLMADIAVDTTAARLWMTTEASKINSLKDHLQGR